ncbi:hypothetical protein JT358_03205 [Micrococcales bacterium 31B]|nr:hypothetical protein [Micrococcales bacterium 31B]
MTTAESLLHGPRGRRLVFGFVCASAEVNPAAGATRSDLMEAFRDAASRFDPRHGRPDAPDTTPSPGSQNVDAAVSHLLDLMRGVALVPVDEASALNALNWSIRSRRGARPTDGEDALLGEPRVREALEGAARALAGSAAVSWWDAPVDRTTQWELDWETGEPLEAPEGTCRERLDVWREILEQAEATARVERPADPRAPWGGLWWSTPTARLHISTREVGEHGPLGLAYLDEDLGGQRASATPLGIPAAAAVYEVRCGEDWAALCRAFPIDITHEMRHEWFRATGRNGVWVIPDWSRVAERFGGVHVSVGAYLEAAGTVIDVGADRASMISGWNPDETFWFHDEVAPNGPHRMWLASSQGAGTTWLPVSA